MTLNETADFVSEGLETWQRNVNYEWLEQIHAELTNGGLWCCPALGITFEKTPEGFEIIGAADDVTIN